MEIKDLVKNVVYRMVSPNDGSTYIVMVDEENNKFLIEIGRVNLMTTADFSGSRPWIIAPWDEEEWMRACIAKGEYIPKSEITRSYSIY